MATAILSGSGTSSGVGFAVPVDLLRDSAAQILSNGRVVRPVVGVSFAPEGAARLLGAPGLLVLEAFAGGPAAGAVDAATGAPAPVVGTRRDADGRLVLGDVVVSADGSPVRVASDLYRALDSKRVGDTLELGLLRGAADPEAAPGADAGAAAPRQTVRVTLSGRDASGI